MSDDTKIFQIIVFGSDKKGLNEVKYSYYGI